METREEEEKSNKDDTINAAHHLLGNGVVHAVVSVLQILLGKWVRGVRGHLVPEISFCKKSLPYR